MHALGNTGKNINTSPAAHGTRTSSTTCSIAAQAHLAHAQLQSSGSPLHRNTKTVAQSAFLALARLG
jgi:hypothetical protein